jgi:hypothetical protein
MTLIIGVSLTLIVYLSGGVYCVTLLIAASLLRETFPAPVDESVTVGRAIPRSQPNIDE